MDGRQTSQHGCTIGSPIPTDKVANTVAVICSLHHMNSLKHEFSGTRAYKDASTEEKSIVNYHLIELPRQTSYEVLVS